MNLQGEYVVAYKGLTLLLLLILTAPFVQAGDELTLAEVLQLTQSASPLLVAAELSGQVAIARLEQSGQRLNPGLQVEWEDLAGSGDLSGIGSSAWTVALSQTIELGGKRSRRQALFQQRVESSQAAQELKWSELKLQVTEAYVTAWAIQARAELQGELVELSRQLVEQEEIRRQAGASSTAMLSRTRAGLAAARATFARIEGQRNAAYLRLAAFWNVRDTTGFLLADPANEPVACPGDPDAAGLQTSGPDLALWRAIESESRAALELERSGSKPDLSLGVGLRNYHETGDQALVLGAEIPLALFDRKRGAIQAAAGELEILRYRSQAAATERYAASAAAIQERRAAWEEQRSLRQDILPEARSAFQATEAGFAEGRFSLIEVLETRRFLFELRDSLIDARARYHLSDARIARYFDNAGTSSDSAIREDY